MGEKYVDIESQLEKMETIPVEFKCYFSENHKRSHISFEVMFALMGDFEVTRELLESAVANEKLLETDLLKSSVELNLMKQRLIHLKEKRRSKNLETEEFSVNM